MSFLTLFTADAAAAHGHEFSKSASAGRVLPAMRRNSGKDRTPSGQYRLTPIPSAASTIVFEDPLATPPPPPPSMQTEMQKKSPRTKTLYHLAQPPPGSNLLHMHSLKPSRNLVVQLQRLSNTARPVPVLDVLPASIFASSRLKATCGKFFKNGVGTQDLVYLTSEEYGEDRDENEDEASDTLNSRRIVASISQNYKKAAGDTPRAPAIRLDSGSPWEVSQTNVGGYEFSARQDDGSMATARWNPRPQSRRTSRGDTAGDGKFQFSLVSPESRRHPIIATLGKQTIEINDQYPTHSPPVGSRPASAGTSHTDSRSSSPTASRDTPTLASSPSSSIAFERTYAKTPEHIRTLILVSGTWVALREGLATTATTTTTTTTTNTSTNALSLDDATPLSPTFSFTLSPTCGRFSPTASINNGRHSGSMRSSSCPVPADVIEETPRSRLMRSGTMLAHQATTGTNGHTLYNSSALPKRSASTATRRSSSNVLRNLGLGGAPTNGSGTPSPETIPVKARPTTPQSSRCLIRPRRSSRQPPHDRNPPLPASPGKSRRLQEKVRDGEVEKEMERKRGRGKFKGFMDMLRRVGVGGGSGSGSASASAPGSGSQSQSRSRSRSGGSRSSR